MAALQGLGSRKSAWQIETTKRISADHTNSPSLGSRKSAWQIETTRIFPTLASCSNVWEAENLRGRLKQHAFSAAPQARSQSLGSRKSAWQIETPSALSVHFAGAL